jgi:membrane-bound lytic murein transglycosylase D
VALPTQPTQPMAPVATAGAPAPDPVITAAPPAASEPIVVPVPLDPLEPTARIDLDSRAARVDLWDRVRKGFAMPDLAGPLVVDREQWYSTRPDYVGRMMARGSRYLFHIVEELTRRGMPTELALLPFIESAFNPQAMSVAAASGMWQFIPSTGRDFELTQNVFRDDRRDVLQSTRAALDYLQRLHGMFGDWHLALAAYNWGEGSVQRAMAANKRAGLPTDYESLRMPTETRQYVPKLQAVKNIVASPDRYGLALPELQNHPYFLSVPIGNDIDVALAAKLAGMTLEEFQALNPSMNKPVILAAGTPQVLLPYDNANRFVRELPKHRGPLASWTAWVAPKTMRPAEAAQAIGVDEDDLREINRIPPRMLVKAGSVLVVPRGKGAIDDVSRHVATNAFMALAPDVPPARRATLRAGARDSVASVARRYGVKPADVADWNKVGADATFARGQTIVVYVPNRAAARPSGDTRARVAAATPRLRRSVRGTCAWRWPVRRSRRCRRPDGHAHPLARVHGRCGRLDATRGQRNPRGRRSGPERYVGDVGAGSARRGTLPDETGWPAPRPRTKALVNGPLEGKGAVRVPHRNHILRSEPPLEDQLRDGVLDLPLDGALERPRAEHRVEAGLGDLGQCRGRDVEPHVHRFEPLLERAQLDPGDRGDVGRVESMEDDRLVDPVQELGPEVLLDLAPDRILDLLERLPRHLHDVLRAEVRRHHDHGVLEVDRATLAVGQAAVVEHLQQDVEDVGLRLLDLVEQRARCRACAHRLGQVAALVVADVARRARRSFGRPSASP